MLSSLSAQDFELDLAAISTRDIMESITLQDVKDFLESLEVDQIEVNEEKQYLVCPTICHNPLHDHASMKLYWYQDHKCFRCYTECNEAMSIFTLYQKYMDLNYHSVTFAEAELYVKRFLKHIAVSTPQRTSSYVLDIEKYKFNNKIPELPEFNSNILSYFTKYHHPLWLKDGISAAAMDKFQISFWLGQNRIIIPHFDIKGRLVGIRARLLEEQDIAQGQGKYMPIQVGDTLYAHPLQFNLYGIYEHKDGIQRRRSAIIAEGEKSVLLDETYYGKLSNTVACCGSKFNKYHISLLTDILGVNEITIAFDKEYNDWRDDKAKAYRAKIENECKPYLSKATFSYIWDYDNLLNEKDSPFDKGKDIFEHLYKTRVKVR